MNFFADLLFVGFSNLISVLLSAPITILTQFLIALATGLIA